MNETILACDLGTSSCKLAAFGADGTALAAAAETFPTRMAGAAAEQDATDWLRAFRAAVACLAGRGQMREAACIALTGQMSAALPVDAAGAALRPCMIWSDQRAVAETGAIGGAVGEEAFYRITGNPLSPTYTIAKALWIRRHEPAVYAATAKFLQPKDWLIAQLTGVMAIDGSDASCTGLLDLAAGAWDAGLARAAGLDADKLPEIGGAAEVIGRVSADGARLSGLPAGLPVVLGGGDGPVSALGAGIAAPGQSYVSLGTSAWISSVSAAPVADPARRLFSLRHVVPGLFAHTGATQNAAGVLAWLSGTLGGGLSLEEALAGTPPGAEGLLCLPYLNGERTPYWNPDAAGVFFGLRQQHRPAHLLRAAAEGICHHLRLIADTFADLGMAAEEMVALGGLAASPGFVRLLAAAMGCRLRAALDAGHATCRGAAMLGAAGTGLFGGLQGALEWPRYAAPAAAEPPTSARLAADYPVFLELYRRMAPLFRSAAGEVPPGPVDASG